VCPWILLYSEGSHNHPPPPPVKIPQQIQGELRNILDRLKEPNITYGKITTD